MKGPRKSRLQDAASEIDLRLGDLLGQLGDALAEAAERLENGDSGEVRREREFDTGSGPIRASAGIKISTLGARVQTSGKPSGGPSEGRRPDTPVNTPGPAAPEAASGPAPRKVDATVFDEKDHWFVVADMPGITQADVTLTETGEMLRIEAVSATRHYILETPRPAGWARFVCTVQNGILEVQAIASEAET